jgi:hypothetical protein
MVMSSFATGSFANPTAPLQPSLRGHFLDLLGPPRRRPFASPGKGDKTVTVFCHVPD